MGRPADWEPLAGSDPVPGDPAAISSEAAHLAGVAQLIAGQVSQLRKIASGQSDERGKHVAKLKTAASDTAGQLAKVVGRYQKTAAALTNWVPDLEHAQSQSLKALYQAQDAAARVRANQPVTRPPGTKVTSADKQADQARARALGQAQSDLGAAQALLASAVSYRDQKGSETASKINSAINDGMKDSFWDDLGGFFSSVGSFFSSIGNWIAKNWVPLLKDICEALEIIATVLAIICLFIPGVDIVAALLMVAFAATVLAAIGRGVLAATGNGSWLEFGLDVVSALTLGLGSFAASPALDSAAESVQEAAGESGVEKYFGSTVGRLIGESRAAEIAAQFAKDDAEAAATAAQKAGIFERAWNTFKAGGSLKDMMTYSKITGLASRYGSGSTQMATAVADGSRALNTLRLTGGTAGLLGLSGVVGSGGEMMNMQGHDVFRVHIPGISNLWDQGVHDTTGAIPGWRVAVSNAGG